MAAPFAAVWGIEAIGFRAGAAAGMMSANDIAAAGGGVVAVGAVATFQSIGAAGLGVMGTTAAMGGGALVGNAVVRTAAAVVNGEKDSERDTNSSTSQAEDSS